MTTKIRLLLRELRTSRDLSQEEVAQALNLSRQSIISLERGEYLPSSPVLLALMEFFNCPIEQLVDGIKVQQIENIKKGGEENMQITPWNPFQAIDRMQEEMNEMVEKNFGRGDWSRALAGATGAMNIHETPK